MLVGYVKHTEKVPKETQIKALRAMNCVKYIEHDTERSRQCFTELISTLRAGDTVIIYDKYRLFGSMDVFLERMKIIRDKGCTIKCIKDKWLNTVGNDARYGNLAKEVLNGLIDFKKEVFQAKVTENNLKNKDEKGRLTKECRRKIGEMHKNGISNGQIASELSLNKQTVSKYVKKYEQTKRCNASRKKRSEAN